MSLFPLLPSGPNARRVARTPQPRGPLRARVARLGPARPQSCRICGLDAPPRATRDAVEVRAATTELGAWPRSGLDSPDRARGSPRRLRRQAHAVVANLAEPVRGLHAPDSTEFRSRGPRVASNVAHLEFDVSVDGCVVAARARRANRRCGSPRSCERRRRYRWTHPNWFSRCPCARLGAPRSRIHGRRREEVEAW